MVQEEQCRLVVTCADNRALEFYLKQGFTFTTSIPLGVNQSSLEHYTNSTFMYLPINPQIDYQHERAIYQHQRKALVEDLTQRLCVPISYPIKRPPTKEPHSKKRDSYTKLGIFLSQLASQAEPEVMKFPERLEKITFLRFSRPIDLTTVVEAYRAGNETQVEDIMMLLVSFLRNAWSFYRENDRLRGNIEGMELSLEGYLSVE